MRQRAISSIGVVLIGLVPALLGGWVFAVAFTAIVAIAYRGYDHQSFPVDHPLCRGITGHSGWTPATGQDGNAIALLCILSVGLPLAASVFLTHEHGGSSTGHRPRQQRSTLHCLPMLRLVCEAMRVSRPATGCGTSRHNAGRPGATGAAWPGSCWRCW